MYIYIYNNGDCLKIGDTWVIYPPTWAPKGRRKTAWVPIRLLIRSLRKLRVTSLRNNI